MGIAPEKIKQNVNAEFIWYYLSSFIANPYGVAGLMGCLYLVSKMDPHYGFNNEMSMDLYYLNDEDRMNSFVHNGNPVGIGCWDNWIDKQGIYNLAKLRGLECSDLLVQLELLKDDISLGYRYTHAYYTINRAKSLYEVVDTMRKGYFKIPASGISMLDGIDLEATEYARYFFNAFKDKKLNDLVALDDNNRLVGITVASASIKDRPSIFGKTIVKAGGGCTFRYIGRSENEKWYAVYRDGQFAWVRSSKAEVYTRSKKEPKNP